MAAASTPLRDPTPEMEEYMIDLAMVAAKMIIDEYDPGHKLSFWSRNYDSWKIPKAVILNPADTKRILYNCKCMAWDDAKETSPDAPYPKDSVVEKWWKDFVISFICDLYDEIDAAADSRSAATRYANIAKANAKKATKVAFSVPLIDDLDSHVHKDDFDHHND